MPPVGNKGKSKTKDGRHSRSRNTTPSSVISAPITTSSSQSLYLDIPLSAVVIPSSPGTSLYDDILERYGGGGGIPDPKHLETIKEDLAKLGQLAATREKACDTGIRELSSRRKQRVDEEIELDQATRREAEEKAHLKRLADDDELDKSNKAKAKKRKDQGKVREERPLTHGAHGLARQDGVDASPKAKPATPHKGRPSTASGSSSSLSPTSHILSPVATNQPAAASGRGSPAGSSSTEDSHQPPPAASIPQFQTFGTNPLEFDDPTVYHVRDITPDMGDDQKREIYCVSTFPHSDLGDLIAGNPPDKDFSNAKPSNQVNANTFATYIEPFFRPLTDEDMAFLKERGDRVNPYIIPRRGTKHYTQIWAEEDGSAFNEVGRDRLPANQSRGNIDQMDDEVAETDQVSTGPMLSRLLATMRVEHRPEDKDRTNGMINGEFLTNGNSNGDIGVEQNGDATLDDRSLPATAFADSSNPAWKNGVVQKQDYDHVDERLKQELRYIGFLGEDDEPDYDAHNDDEIAQRLRLLQAQLKEQTLVNAARKARLSQHAEEHMGYQEFAHIKEDLDTQVVQAFSKRNRTLGKGKKNAKRPGGAGAANSLTGAGVPRPGIGDAARSIMDRRRRWNDTVSPIFSDDIIKVRTSDQSIFKDEDMAAFYVAEKERFEEEGDGE